MNFNDLEKELDSGNAAVSTDASTTTQTMNAETSSMNTTDQGVSTALQEITSSTRQARASVGLEPDQATQPELNRLNTIKIYWSFLNVDVANSENFRW